MNILRTLNGDIDGTKFFNDYLIKLDEFRKYIPFEEKLNEANRQLVRNLAEDLSEGFDRFRYMLHSVDYYGFPRDFSKLESGYNDYVGYLNHSDYFELKNNRFLLIRRLKDYARRKVNPIWLTKELIRKILRIPQWVIFNMGFNPENFINSTIGKGCAWLFFLVVALLLFSIFGFTATQIVEIFKLLNA